MARPFGQGILVKSLEAVLPWCFFTPESLARIGVPSISQSQ